MPLAGQCFASLELRLEKAGPIAEARGRHVEQRFVLGAAKDCSLSRRLGTAELYDRFRPVLKEAFPSCVVLNGE